MSRKVERNKLRAIYGNRNMGNVWRQIQIQKYKLDVDKGPTTLKKILGRLSKIFKG